MKFTLTTICSFVMLLVFMSSGVFCQDVSAIREVVVVPEFAYGGEIWTEQLGEVAAEAFISRMRMDGEFLMPNPESVMEVLQRLGIQEAYDADLRRLSEGIRIMQARFAVVGRISDISQLQEAPGKIVVKVTIDVHIIDANVPFIITSERIEGDAKIKQMLTADSPWDEKTAKNILKSAVSRLRQRFRIVFQSQTM
jgi:hypothetical protein